MDKTIIPKDTCIPMFIAAPFTIVMTWKQPKCPTDKEDVMYTCIVEYYSAIKRMKSCHLQQLG